MSDIYVAPAPHCCQTPEKYSRPVGSIWLCDECGTYYRFGYNESSWGPVWTRVRWWNFRAKRLIRDAQKTGEVSRDGS